MPVMNRTRNTLLSGTLLLLNSRFRRELLYLIRNGIPGDCAVWITPCHAIYTVGMKKPVDIAFLDKDGRVIKVLRNLPPNCRVDSVPGTAGAIELPSNRLSESCTDTGDILELDLS